MANSKVLHILFPEKFFHDYINFINENFDKNDHLFLYLKKKGNEPTHTNVKVLKFYRFGPLFYWELYKYMNSADKIILHSLSKVKVIQFLFFFRKFAKKCYWYLWGGDLYYRIEKQKKPFGKYFSNFMFSRVVKCLGNVVTHIPGDVAAAKEWFGFKGRHLICFLYPSNLFTDLEINPSDKKGTTLNILLGNSSHKSNNHINALKKIASLRKADIKIICPLSYGDDKNAKKVIEFGKNMFGEKFIPVINFMSLREYKQLLADIDIAVFNHWRQQAIGNIIFLLGLGKTVYINREVTTWNMLLSKDITVLNFENEETLQELSYALKVRNKEMIKKYFSKPVLIEESKVVFSS